MSRAFVFPGQGAQTIGMGRALADAYPAARAVFDEVDAALGEKLSTLIWEGSIEELTLTRNAQPALMATSIAALRALEVTWGPGTVDGESDDSVLALMLTDADGNLYWHLADCLPGGIDEQCEFVRDRIEQLAEASGDQRIANLK